MDQNQQLDQRDLGPFEVDGQLMGSKEVKNMSAWFEFAIAAELYKYCRAPQEEIDDYKDLCVLAKGRSVALQRAEAAEEQAAREQTAALEAQLTSEIPEFSEIGHIALSVNA